MWLAKFAKSLHIYCTLHCIFCQWQSNICTAVLGRTRGQQILVIKILTSASGVSSLSQGYSFIQSLQQITLFFFFFFFFFFFITVYFIHPTHHITPSSGLGTGRLSKYTLKHIWSTNAREAFYCKGEPNAFSIWLFSNYVIHIKSYIIVN